MLQPNLEYNPRKKGRALKIIAQILSTLFTAVMIIGFISCVATDAPRYIPAEKVNLYNTNYYDVYELKDLKVVSKYSSDDDFDYYLVLLPYKDETIKAASFRGYKYYFDDNAEKKEIVGSTISVGVTVDTVDLYNDDFKEAYNRAVDDLKNNGMHVVSTELDFTFACENNADFSDYYDTDKSSAVFSTVFLAVLSIVGVILMIASYKSSNYNPEQTYFVPGSNKTSLDFDFDKRF